MEAVEKADRLMKDGHREQAAEVLERLLRENPTDSQTFNDAVSIYFLGRMYNEARAVFQLYKSNTGEDLRGDFDLHEIEAQELRDNDRAATTHEGAKIFRRIPRWTRIRHEDFGDEGHLTIRPIREIRILPDGLVIKRLGGEYSYKWGDVREARIQQRERIGKNLGKWTSRLLVLLMPDRVLKIPITSAFPVIGDVDSLLSEIRKNVTILEERRRRYPEERDWFLFLFLIVLSVLAIKFCPRP